GRPNSCGAHEPICDFVGSDGPVWKPGYRRHVETSAGIQYISEVQQFVCESDVAGRVVAGRGCKRDQPVDGTSGWNSLERSLWRVGVLGARAGGSDRIDGSGKWRRV